tara:strand:+ start:12161 stop:12868 length:708 start_codon:yes stop_codon:yes gene_type:complete
MAHRLVSTSLLTATFLVAGCSSPSPDIETNHTKTSPAALDVTTWVSQQLLTSEGIELDASDMRYLTGSADLNQDGQQETIVLMQDRYFCGSGGCSAFIFDQSGKVISRMTVVKPPVILADSYRNGWQDFIVWSNGAYRLMSFNGESYPANPSLEPTIDRKEEQQLALAYVMATELYQQDGYDIMPAPPSQLWTPAKQYHFTFKHYGDPEFIYHAIVDLNNGDIKVDTLPIEELGN